MMIHCQYGAGFLLLEGKGGFRHAKGVAVDVSSDLHAAFLRSADGSI